MAQNFGLRQLDPSYSLTDDDINNLQLIEHQKTMPQIAVFSKGYNEFTLYGEDLELYNIDKEQSYYYMYTGLTWTDPFNNRPVTAPYSAYGVFLQNQVDFSLDGWICEIAPQTQYGWLCESFVIAEKDFDKEARDLPV